MIHNILFICGKNRLRSPTAEHVFADWPGIETASAGTGQDADCPVSAELIAWAKSGRLTPQPVHGVERREVEQRIAQRHPHGRAADV